jgi:endonuclease/exonuclease/phosphatase family metal-dependent hydrolase
VLAGPSTAAVAPMVMMAAGGSFGRRVSIMTLNVWKKDGVPAKWPARRQAFVTCLATFQPDILCIQEVGDEGCDESVWVMMMIIMVMIMMTSL